MLICSWHTHHGVEGGKKTWLEEGQEKRKKNLNSLLTLHIGAGICYFF
jgi:hypothetical protein